MGFGGPYQLLCIAYPYHALSFYSVVYHLTVARLKDVQRYDGAREYHHIWYWE